MTETNGLRVLAVAFLLVLPSCFGYLPGRQTFWDDEVRELCRTDGGVRIYKRIQITDADIRLLGKVDGKIVIPSRQSALPGSPVVSEMAITTVKREGSIHLWRAESLIKRPLDNVVLARWVTYTRSGGDLPSPVHTTSFTCPSRDQIASDLQELFIFGARNEP